MPELSISLPWRAAPAEMNARAALCNFAELLPESAPSEEATFRPFIKLLLIEEIVDQQTFTFTILLCYMGLAKYIPIIFQHDYG